MFLRAHGLGVIALTAAVSMAACDGGGPRTALAPTTPTTAASGPVTTLVPVTQPVNHTLYYSGFALKLGVATLHSTEAGGLVVDVATTFGNEGTNPAAFEASLDLTSGGNHYQPDDVSAKLPTVPGQAQSAGNLSFDVDDKFTFNDAVLTIGQSSHEQVVLPLTSDAGVVDLSPITFALSGTATTGPLKLDVKSGVLRADDPTNHLEADKGKRFLSIAFDVMNTSDFAGGYAFTHDNIALKLANGTQIAPDEGPIELVSPTSTLAGQTARFTVPTPGTGSFQVVLIDDVASPHTTSAIAITVPAARS